MTSWPFSHITISCGTRLGSSPTITTSTLFATSCREPRRLWNDVNGTSPDSKTSYPLRRRSRDGNRYVGSPDANNSPDSVSQLPPDKESTIFQRRSQLLWGIRVDLVEVRQKRWLSSPALQSWAIPDIKCLEATFNKHLADDLIHFTPASLTTLILHICEPYPTPTPRKRFENAIKNALKSLVNLRTFVIAFVDHEGGVLQPFSNNSWTGTSLGHNLEWYGTALKALPHPERLQRLELLGCNAPLSLSTTLSRFFNIQKLRLTSKEDAAGRASTFERLVSVLNPVALRELEAVVPSTPHASLDLFETFVHLTRLIIRVDTDEWTGVEPIKALTSIQHLDLTMSYLRSKLDLDVLQCLVEAWKNIQVLHLTSIDNDEFDDSSEAYDSDSGIDPKELKDDDGEPALYLDELEILGMHNCASLMDLKITVATPYCVAITPPSARFSTNLALNLCGTTLDRTAKPHVENYMKALWRRGISFTPGKVGDPEWASIVEHYRLL